MQNGGRADTRSEVDPNPPSRDPEGHDLRMDGVGSKMMHYSTTPPLQPAVVLHVVLYSLPVLHHTTT